MQNSYTELLTVKGCVENIIFVNDENGYAVLDVSTDEGELITAVGTLAQLCVGERVTMYGAFKSHTNFGEQFRVETYEVRLPETTPAILKYLQGGALPYIGVATAKKIVELFGDASLEIIATDPQKLSKIKGLTILKARKIQEEFRRMHGVRDTMAYFATLNLEPQTAIEMYAIYGEDTRSYVQSNPYLLCGHPCFLNFATADKIAADMCLEYDSSQRISAGITFVLRHNLQNGHTCVPKDKLLLTVSDFLRVEPENVSSHTNRMIDDRTICVHSFGEKEYVFMPEYLSAERDIAGDLKDRAKQPPLSADGFSGIVERIELINNIKYAPLQRQAIVSALCNRVMVLTGGPGTGKTTAVNGILSAVEQRGDRVSLAAPTGRAAKRLSELTGRVATTIHRLLEVEFSKNNVVSFKHNEKNLLKCDVVVIDEMSMVDVLLFQSLLCALRPSCKIIMVGDEDQLPSVGAGSVLSSVISSGVVPVIRLTEIFRQAALSDIVSNAHRIVAGEKLQLSGRESDFFVLEQRDVAACADLVCDLVSRRLPESYGFDSMEDIQVLCPTKLGGVGTTALNAKLQQKINPESEGKPQLVLQDRILRLGDKVMQTKNNYDIQYTRTGGTEGLGAFNGDMGIIIAVDKRSNSVTVRSEDRVYTYPSENVYELEPAYAVTIHKSQGSEFAAVIIPVMDVPQKLSYRNLLYTGVTRARKLCILPGQPHEIDKMIKNVRQNKRFSCLANFLTAD